MNDIQKNQPVSFGDLNSVTPFSSKFGFDRGQPVDRLFIDEFLEQNRQLIQGTVLEIGDDSYTRQFSADEKVVREVLHVHDTNATYTGDLLTAEIPCDRFDAIIFTQTLQFIYDFQGAMRRLHDILRPGGTLLLTTPGISQISTDQWADVWFWSFTTRSIRQLATDVFGAEAEFEVGSRGNVYSAIGFLEGLAVEDLDRAMLSVDSAEYEVLVTLRATKA